IGIGGMNADEVAANSSDQRAFRGYRPRLDVGLEEVGILFEVLRRGVLTSLTSEGSGTDQRGNVRRQRRGRVAAAFLPTLLRGDRPMVDEITGRSQHHRVRIKVLEGP